MSADVTLGSWQELGVEAYAIRHAVFVDEQGVPVELEQDEHDASAVHALLRNEDGFPAATGRLLSDGHIGRIAVLKAFRGQGLGRSIVLSLIAEAALRGHANLSLHAQKDALDFYTSLGFVAEGGVFIEAGIPHIAMSRVL